MWRTENKMTTHGIKTGEDRHKGSTCTGNTGGDSYESGKTFLKNLSMFAK